MKLVAQDRQQGLARFDRYIVFLAVYIHRNVVFHAALLFAIGVRALSAAAETIR